MNEKIQPQVGFICFPVARAKMPAYLESRVSFI